MEQHSDFDWRRGLFVLYLALCIAWILVPEPVWEFCGNRSFPPANYAKYYAIAQRYFVYAITFLVVIFFMRMNVLILVLAQLLILLFIALNTYAYYSC